MRFIASNVGDVANLEPPGARLMERDGALDAMAQGMPAVVKVTAAAVVATIALALLLVHPDSQVAPAATLLIAASPLAQPLLMLLLVTFTFAGYALIVWVPYRRFRRRAVKTIERFPHTAIRGRAAGSRQLRRSDMGQVFDDTGQPVATIHRVADGTFIILVLVDVFDHDLDITHPTQEDAFRALEASYHPL